MTKIVGITDGRNQTRKARYCGIGIKKPVSLFLANTPGDVDSIFLL